ncbi:hypothetical protein [Acidianus manzaensis]|uniref:Uncharacterized protein n=1 Tax=Acidianus manzaensis TaxID=282676 RepID=A0A1W6K2T1_9CREN|nr:hypothetical protein [Acidianus manzaensis]ARM76843.1 hypothetical protein B6F84_12990 [Acidianus manzaensis]
MLSELMDSFSAFIEHNDKISRKFPREVIDKMEHYSENKYCQILEIGEFCVKALTNPLNEDFIKTISEEYKKMKEEFDIYNSIVEHNTTIGEYKRLVENKLGKLIDELRINLDKFAEEVKEYSGDFIISYYSIYLHFITCLYFILDELKITNYNIKTVDSPKERKLINLISFTVFIFAIPIIAYIKRKEIMEEITSLQGIMLYFLAKDKTFVNPNSFGHKIFQAIFNG